MNKPITILAPRGRDAAVIAKVLQHVGIPTRICADLRGVLAVLEDSAAVMLTQESLSGDAVPDVLSWIEHQKAWSDLAFIVLIAKDAVPRSDRYRSSLEKLGNAVLLERPLNADSLVSAARVALRARQRQLALRELTETLENRVVERTAALAESEAQLRAVFEGFPDNLVVLAVTEDGRFLFDSFGPSAERSSGFSKEQVIGRSIEDFLPEEVAGKIVSLCRRCLAEDSSLTFTEQMRFGASDGIYETTMTPIRDSVARTSRILVFSRDVSERFRLEERVRSAQKLEAVGQLTGGIAHDFNNLLQVVTSGLALLERTDDKARRGQIADSVRRAALRGGDLTKRLLTIARRQSLNPEPLDLFAWLHGGAAELLTRTLRGDIAVRVEVPAGLAPIEVDAAELELAVLNLAVNSRDAMPEGGTLTVSAEQVEIDAITDPDELSGSFVRLAVTDTGTGMTAEVQARVFEPFFTTKEVGKGTGLGLAQVYGFARQSGGGVRVRSTPGHGTTISLLLPIARAAPRRQPTEQVSRVIGPPSGAAILVCEDDDDVAALVVDMLSQLGYSNTRVSTAAAALGALVDGRKVDLLFTDVLMPGGMDGLALAREAVRRRPGLPVLLTTGYTGEPGTEPLGVPVLRKPYGLGDLEQAVLHALGRRMGSEAQAGLVTSEDVQRLRVDT